MSAVLILLFARWIGDTPGESWAVVGVAVMAYIFGTFDDGLLKEGTDAGDQG
jgi:hypothetical protein